MKHPLYRTCILTYVFGVLWLICMLIGFHHLHAIHRPERTSEYASTWFWWSAVLAALSIGSRMFPGIIVVLRRKRLGERVPALEILRARTNMELQRLEASFSLTAAEHQESKTSTRAHLVDSANYLLRRVSALEAEFTKLGGVSSTYYRFSLADIHQRVAELSQQVHQVTTENLLVHHRKASDTPVLQPSEEANDLFLLEDVFAPRPHRARRIISWLLFLPLAATLLVGGIIIFFLYDITTLAITDPDYLDFAELTYGGPLALAGLLFGALFSLRCYLWLDEKVRFGSLAPTPSPELQKVSSCISQLLKDNALGDSTYIESRAKKRIKAVGASRTIGSVSDLYTTSLYLAAARYAQLAAVQNQNQPQFQEALARLEKWVATLKRQAVYVGEASRSEKENANRFRRKTSPDRFIQRLLQLDF